MDIDIKIEVCEALPCCCAVFKVNDVDYNYRDFVCMYDADPDNAPNYGCGDMKAKKFDTCKVRRNLLHNEHNLETLSDDDIYFIQCKLCDALHVGRCAWCA